MSEIIDIISFGEQHGSISSHTYHTYTSSPCMIERAHYCECVIVIIRMKNPEHHCGDVAVIVPLAFHEGIASGRHCFIMYLTKGCRLNQT